MPTATEGRQAPTSNGIEPSPTKNLHQRIAAITGEANVKATGSTEFGQRTISIGDVDEVLAELMAKHGITSDFEFNAEPSVAYEQPTRSEGVLRMWMVNITGIVTNADNPKEEERRQLFDIGSNPSAAVSFALKRWYRALFKLVEDDDQAGANVGKTGSTSREARGGQGRPDLLVCPDCGTKAVIKGKEEYGGGWVCFKRKDGCGAKFPDDDNRITSQLGGPQDEAPPVSVGNTEAPPLGPDELDPDVKVCPNCGKAEALRRKPVPHSDRAYCKGDMGGCGAEFDAAGVPTRAEFIEKLGPAQPSRLEQTVAEAGMTPEDTEQEPQQFDQGGGLPLDGASK